MRIAVVGLGKIGLQFALVSAEANHDVVGVEKNKERIREVKPELYVQEKLLLKDREIVFIVVGTYGESSKFETDKITWIIKELKDYLTKEAMVCVVSTVNVGDIKKFKKIYENIAYCPVMVAQGNIANDLKNAEYVFIGCDGDSDKLEDFWRTIAPNSPQIVTSTRNVEIAKIALNFLLTLKIALVNCIGNFCEKHGGNIEEIVDAFKYDTRLSGKRMWKSGLGFGGPCFPKDIDNWLCHNPHNDLGLAVKQENKFVFEKSINYIKKHLPPNGTVTILGLTYKPETALVIESQAQKIYETIVRKLGVVTFSYDPSIKGQFPNAKECVKKADVIFVAVPWNEFKELEPKDFREEQVVIDPWRVLLNKKLPCKYVAYGVGEK